MADGKCQSPPPTRLFSQPVRTYLALQPMFREGRRCGPLLRLFQGIPRLLRLVGQSQVRFRNPDGETEQTRPNDDRELEWGFGEHGSGHIVQRAFFEEGDSRDVRDERCWRGKIFQTTCLSLAREPSDRPLYRQHSKCTANSISLQLSRTPTRSFAKPAVSTKSWVRSQTFWLLHVPHPRRTTPNAHAANPTTLPCFIQTEQIGGYVISVIMKSKKRGSA